MSGKTYKYGDHIPMDVMTLETSDRDIRFERKGKGWNMVKHRNWTPDRTYYNNSGDLLWEWGHSYGLTDVTDAYQSAVKYFTTSYGNVAKKDPRNLYISPEAKKHMHALIAKIQEEN